MGGDFNFAMDPIIDRYGTGSYNNDNSANWVSNHIENINYLDVWRHYHPDENGFTWRRLRPTLVCSRLDYFLISEAFAQFVNKVKIRPGF